MGNILNKFKKLLTLNNREEKVKIDISENGVMSVKSSEYFRHDRAHKLVDDLKRVKIHKVA